MRMVCTESAEGRTIVESLVRLDAAKPERERQNLAAILSLPFLLIMEYVKGRTLKDIAFHPNDWKRDWCGNTFGNPGALSEVCV